MDYSPHFNQRMRHTGQLKLLCSEIAFLNRFPDATTVVYAGAAPGLHIPRLASMFPRIYFILIDPAISALGRHPSIEVMRTLMTDELADDLAMRFDDLLFISDVRVGPPVVESDRDQQLRIQRDMDAQMGWHRHLKARCSLLKFRLPWDLAEETPYLQGTIYLPIFGKRLTHETRLMVERDAKMTVYDNRRYERQMAYFNRVLRVASYDGGRCYDQARRRRLLGQPRSGGGRVR